MSKFERVLFWLPCISCMISGSVFAQGNLNMQGVSGLLNVPDASVLDYGSFTIGFDNQEDGGITNRQNLNGTGNDLHFSVGLLPNIEITGRNTSGKDTDGGSDLSFNYKLRSPFTILSGLEFAVGELDVGGAANKFDTQFAVATYSTGRLRATLGIGKVSTDRDEGTGRLDGLFGGFDVKVANHLSVLLEDDGYSTNFGLRVSAPSHWLPFDWALSGLYMYSDEEGLDGRQDWYGIQLKIPLANDYARELPVSRERGNTLAGEPVGMANKRQTYEDAQVQSESSAQGDSVELSQQKTAGFSTSSNGYPVADIDGPASNSVQSTLRPSSVRQELPRRLPPKSSASEEARRVTLAFPKKYFANVRAAKQGREWIIAFENVGFANNDLDALGVALGIAAKHLQPDERFYLQLEKYGIPVLGVSGAPEEWAGFFDGETALPAGMIVAAPNSRLHFRSRGDGALTTKVKQVREYLDFRPTVTVRPLISSAVGTEFGIFDASIAARADVVLPLWQGAAFNISRDWSVYESNDFEVRNGRPGVFFNQRVTEGVKDKVLSQVIRHGRGLTSMVSCGEFFDLSEGCSYEGRWDPGDGRNRFRIIATEFEDIDDSSIKREARLASWRYFSQRYNSELNLTFGDFFSGDNGFIVDFSQHIGDVRLHLTFRESESERFVGMGFSVPLSPRENLPRIGGVQFRGEPNFRYDISTLVGERSNNLVFARNVIPTQFHNLRNAFFNGDRLSPAYVRANQERLRDAWQAYGN